MYTNQNPDHINYLFWSTAPWNIVPTLDAVIQKRVSKEAKVNGKRFGDQVL